MSSETMLERIAKAMHHYSCTPPGSEGPMPESWPLQGWHYTNLAKAALLAIREPSKDLIDTMDEHALQPSEWIWEAAIDEILNESPTPAVTD